MLYFFFRRVSVQVIRKSHVLIHQTQSAHPLLPTSYLDRWVSPELNSVLLQVLGVHVTPLVFLALSGMEINHMAQEIISLCCGTRKRSKTLSQVPTISFYFCIFFSPFIFHIIAISFISLSSWRCISAFLSFSLLPFSFPITPHVLSAYLPTPNWRTL